MTKITQPPIIPARPSNHGVPVTPAQKIKKDRQEDPPDQPFVERRTNGDRRNRSVARGPYDSRAGKDRRKGSRPGGAIDVDA